MSIVDEGGGGASRSTEPAQGSSTGTDVSLREHLEALRRCDKELADALRAGDLEAVKTALASATKLSEAHNDLLRKMELLVETFATKESVDRRFTHLESWQAKIAGGLATVAFIGIANLVKIWA